MTSSETYNLSVDMSWEIDLFGRQLQNLKAATKDVEQTIENYYGAQVTLTADVASAYITLRGAQAQLEVLQRNVGTRGETTEITRWKQEAGISDMLEVQQAVSTLEQARASIPTLKQTISETKNQLAVLCGRTPGQLDGLLARSDSLPRVPAKIATGIPAEVFLVDFVKRHSAGMKADFLLRFNRRLNNTPMRSDDRTRSRMAACGVREEYLQETFARTSGPGGQHVNKVSTACTIRHAPTGTSVTASDSRSQSTNRQLALERLLELLKSIGSASQKSPRPGGRRRSARAGRSASWSKANGDGARRRSFADGLRSDGSQGGTFPSAPTNGLDCASLPFAINTLRVDGIFPN